MSDNENANDDLFRLRSYLAQLKRLRRQDKGLNARKRAALDVEIEAIEARVQLAERLERVAKIATA